MHHLPPDAPPPVGTPGDGSGLLGPPENDTSDTHCTPPTGIVERADLDVTVCEDIARRVACTWEPIETTYAVFRPDYADMPLHEHEHRLIFGDGLAVRVEHLDLGE